MAEHKNIAAALAAAQMEMGKALKQTTNPHFRSKYADLSSVVDACLEALNKHGISVIQPMTQNDFGRCVTTMFLHASGEKLENPVPLILGKEDMQGLGSAYTYARRYGLMGLAGIAPEDDDGNAAAAAAPKRMSWAQTVVAEMPPQATDMERAKAVADALIAQWQRKKTVGELANEWDRRTADRTIPGIEKISPEDHKRAVDAYEARVIELEPVKHELDVS